jgi:hypothetical protein
MKSSYAVWRHSLAIVLTGSLSLSMCATFALCQDAPGDAKKLMLAAYQVNGLMGPDVHPWHLKTTFKILDDSGNTTDSGTYEEFWVSPTKYKRSYTTSKFTQTDYGTAKGVFRAGQRQQVPAMMRDLQREFIAPMLAPEEVIAQQEFISSTQEIGGDNLQCLIVAGSPTDAGRSWCVQGSELMLRKTSSAAESLQVFHDHITDFRGRSVPGDLRFVRSNKTALTAHLVSIEPLEPSVGLDPSPDATPPHIRVNISAGVAIGMLQKHDAPVYPPGTRVSGTVALGAVIGVDGHVEELHVISGPPVLQKAALDAVRLWTYKTYFLNNEPAEVATQIFVVFTHSRN